MCSKLDMRLENTQNYVDDISTSISSMSITPR